MEFGQLPLIIVHPTFLDWKAGSMEKWMENFGESGKPG